MWQEQLITLYCTVCRYYDSGISEQVQRQSNNFRPQFTDEEVMTIFLWGIFQRRFEKKAIHGYTRMHLLDFFPKLHSYQAFVSRLNYLAPAFFALAEKSIEAKNMEADDMYHLIIDSLPILLAKDSRSGYAKVAPELCDKTYNASRDQWYYGVKLHALVQRRRGSLPFPVRAFTSKASCHDLPVAKEILHNDIFPGFSLLADKAYVDAGWSQSLLQDGISLLTPSKRNRADPPSLPGGDARDSSIACCRQPIEGFFNWLQEKTAIQSASKVRSSSGLLLHISARLSAAFLLLAFPLLFLNP